LRVAPYRESGLVLWRIPDIPENLPCPCSTDSQ
jgi:hypothetical protein